MNKDLHADWLLWQLADSAFPTGGFAHSGGLESAYQLGQVRNGAIFAKWCEAALLQLEKGSLPYIAAAAQKPEELPAIDAHCDAFLSNHVANRASRAQGRSLLAAVDKSFPSESSRNLKIALTEQRFFGHFAPLHGAITLSLGLSLQAAVRLFVFIQLRGWVSSAVRLGIVGPLEAQSIQFKLSPAAEKTADCSRIAPMEEVCQPVPLLDLFQGYQDRLYSRLFQS